MRTAWMATACLVALSITTPAGAEQSDSKRDIPGPRSNPFVQITRESWYTINELVLASAKKMPEEHYGFQPARAVRTFGQILAHIAADHHATCGPAIGRVPPKIDVEKLKTKEEISRFLQDSSAVCDLAYGMLTSENASFRYRALNGEYSRAALLVANLTHDSEHYGNLVTYMRLKGVVPPSSGGVR